MFAISEMATSLLQLAQETLQEKTVRGLVAVLVVYGIPLWVLWRLWKRFVIRRRVQFLESCFKLDKSFNPHSLKIVGKKAEPDLDDIPLLVEEMRSSFNAGRSKPIRKRIDQLKAMRKLFVENEDKIQQALKADLGRPTWEGLYYDILLPLTEIDHLIANLEEWVLPEKKGFNLLTFPSTNQMYKEPKGLVLVIGTWNYPIMLSLVPVVGAIAAGNCVILKPCNVAAHSARLMAELLPRYLDPTIVSVVGTAMTGDRTTTAALLEHKFDHIFFTGSPSVGRVIMEGAARHLTPVTLELGGKNPVFVDKNCNIDLAAKRSVWGRLMNAGQQCISPDYVLCHEEVVEAYLERCSYWAEALYAKGGSPKDNGNLGRIVGDKQMDRLREILENHGGEVVCGGNFDIKARYIEPTVLKVSLDSMAMEEETFGPILLVVPVKSMDAAIEYVASRPKPLSLYIFSNSTVTQERIVNNTSSGGVTINGTLFHAAHPELPFGGIGDSGIGAYHGKATFDIFTHEKPVLKKAIWPDAGLLSDPFFVYPPWTDLKIKVMRFLVKFV